VATILVCDDRQALRDLVRAALAEGDHDIVEARDGAEGVRMAKEILPDVVVLDMVLPDRSGLDVLAELRGYAALANTRVILCTVHNVLLGGDGAEGLGADRYLAKPFSPRELVALLAEIVGTRS
jgi:DNA-binding response OmpR family regulator